VVLCLSLVFGLSKGQRKILQNFFEAFEDNKAMTKEFSFKLQIGFISLSQIATRM